MPPAEDIQLAVMRRRTAKPVAMVAGAGSEAIVAGVERVAEWDVSVRW